MAQLLRRGGLRNGTKVDPASVDGRIAQLRTQAKAETDGKREKAGWEPLSEHAEQHFTGLGANLREALQGSDECWLHDEGSRTGEVGTEHL